MGFAFRMKRGRERRGREGEGDRERNGRQVEKASTVMPNKGRVTKKCLVCPLETASNVYSLMILINNLIILIMIISYY